MKTLRNLFVVLIGLAIAGLAKQPYDKRLEARMQEKGLLPEPIELDTREKLGQTSMAIALGGLRSVIASMMNIGAHVHWENQEWYELEQDYKTVVTLQPKTRYYWTVAAWHLYSNAYADYDRKPGLPEGRRKRKQREFFDKGIDFLDGGLKANPEDWRMWAEKGNALSQWWRPRNLDRAAEAYARAFEISNNQQVKRNHLYALSRITGREAEAWKVAQEMWSVPNNRRFPSPRTIFYSLQHWAQPPTDERVSAEEIFGDYRTAARDIPGYWFRQKEAYPMHGVGELLEELCDRYNVPEEIRPLRFEAERTMSIHPLTGKPHRIDPVTNKPRRRTWSSIWMDEIRGDYLRILKFDELLERAHPTPEDNLSAPEILHNRLLAAREIPTYWFSSTNWIPKQKILPLVEDLGEEFRVPKTIHPLRFPPDRMFSRHPLTDEPFEPDPATGDPTERSWRDIWMSEIRPAYDHYLRQFLQRNR